MQVYPLQEKSLGQMGHSVTAYSVVQPEAVEQAA